MARDPNGLLVDLMQMIEPGTVILTCVSTRHQTRRAILLCTQASAWAQEHGHEQRDALREFYRNDPAETPVDELVTEVVLPING